MRLQPTNLNKVRVINICYIENLFQVVFRIFFCIPAQHWAQNNICAQVYKIQSGINLHYIPTSHIPHPNSIAIKKGSENTRRI